MFLDTVFLSFLFRYWLFEVGLIGSEHPGFLLNSSAVIGKNALNRKSVSFIGDR